MSLFGTCAAHYRQSSRRRYFQHAHIIPINSGCGKERRILFGNPSSILVLDTMLTTGVKRVGYAAGLVAQDYSNEL